MYRRPDLYATVPIKTSASSEQGTCDHEGFMWPFSEIKETIAYRYVRCRTIPDVGKSLIKKLPTIIYIVVTVISFYLPKHL